MAISPGKRDMVEGLDSGQSVCCLETLKHASLSALAFVLILHQYLLTLQLPLLPLLKLTPKILSCLAFCSTCSNCGASWIVLLALKALRYLSLCHPRNWHTVNEPVTWKCLHLSERHRQKSLFQRLCDIFFLFQRIDANPTEVHFFKIYLTLSCCVV